MERALHMIDAARARGLAVTADIYPYIASSTTMTSLFPAWTLEGGMERFLARLADPATRQRIIDEVQGGREGWSRANGSVGWERSIITRYRIFEWVMTKVCVSSLCKSLGC
jgi:N-acyl-D-aspartate/D-glutamate deacylase